MCIPLLSQGEVQGVIDLAIQGSKIGKDDRLAFLESLGYQIGVAIHNSRLYKDEKQARQMAEVLRDASLAVSQTLESEYRHAYLNQFRYAPGSRGRSNRCFQPEGWHVTGNRYRWHAADSQSWTT